MERKQKFVLIAHNIRSIFNVGSLFRTADAVGIDKIYLTGYTPTPHQANPLTANRRGGLGAGQAPDRMAKTALGAEKSVLWEYYFQARRLLKQLKAQKFFIVALEQSKKSIDYRKFEPKFPLALIIGSEIGGLSRQILKYCDTTIELPMRGKKESLNVAVATGVALYKIIESRTK